MLQRDQNTLSDVTFWFQQLYDSFKASSYSETLVALLEKRWADCEQPLFLLAFVLDSNRPDGMNGLPVVMADKLGDFALLYYRNNFDADAPSITGEMSEWMNGKCVSDGKSINVFQRLDSSALGAFWQDAKKNAVVCVSRCVTWLCLSLRQPRVRGISRSWRRSKPLAAT
ncbi:hypothetical protein PI125_g23035 [Phytophthora idaei]|nr:hypothetical protein PI125_g23035 [Phytophthora idaei]